MIFAPALRPAGPSSLACPVRLSRRSYMLFDDAELVVRSLRDASSLARLDVLQRTLRPSRRRRGVNTWTSMTVPSMPGGTRSEVSFTSDAFSPKIARSSFSSGVSWVSPFGVTLPTRMSPGAHLGADVNDAGLVELGQRRLTDVGDVAGDLFRPELGVAGDTRQLLDVDRGEDDLPSRRARRSESSPRSCSRSRA